MRIMIAYDQVGNIVKVAEVGSLPKGITPSLADLTDEHRVLPIEEPEGELREAKLSEIPQQVRINTDTEQLIERQS